MNNNCEDKMNLSSTLLPITVTSLATTTATIEFTTTTAGSVSCRYNFSYLTTD